MRPVVRPSQSAEDTYGLCIGGVKDKELRTRLESIAGDIVNAACDYADRATMRMLHLIPQDEDVSGIVSKDEMISVYDNRMAHKQSRGRPIYDALRGLPDNGICPFCDHGPVSTLDHILPKSLYPALVVAPDNLVGACRECNSLKLNSAPSEARDVPIHPYFDDISEGRWLRAGVVAGTIPAVVFWVQCMDEWTDELNERVARQFECLQLGRLYSSQAAREIAGQRSNLMIIYNARGEAGVREELQDRAKSWEEYNANSWQAVAFEALSESEWYCKEGFARS